MWTTRWTRWTVRTQRPSMAMWNECQRRQKECRGREGWYFRYVPAPPSLSHRTCIQFYIYSSRLSPNACAICTWVQPTLTAPRHLTPIFGTSHTHFRPPSTRFPAPTTRFRMPRHQPTTYIHSTRNACKNVRTCIFKFFFLIPKGAYAPFWDIFLHIICV